MLKSARRPPDVRVGIAELCEHSQGAQNVTQTFDASSACGDFPRKINELASLDEFFTDDDEKFVRIVDNFTRLFLCKHISASNNVRGAMASHA